MCIRDRSKEVFEEALLEFPGTSIIVSHDRYFLNRIPTRIMELTSDGIENYLGTYDYYVEKKQQQIQSGKKYLEGMQEDREARTATAAEEVSKGAGAEMCIRDRHEPGFVKIL